MLVRRCLCLLNSTTCTPKIFLLLQFRSLCALHVLQYVFPERLLPWQYFLPALLHLYQRIGFNQFDVTNAVKNGSMKVLHCCFPLFPQRLSTTSAKIIDILIRPWGYRLVKSVADKPLDRKTSFLIHTRAQYTTACSQFHIKCTDNSFPQHHSSQQIGN